MGIGFLLYAFLSENNKKDSPLFEIMRIKLLIIGFFLIFLIACQVQDEEMIKIGGAFAFTGFASGWGEVERNAISLAIEEINNAGGINGKHVKLIAEDTLSDGTKTVSAVQKLINVDGVKIIIGPTWLDTFGGAAPLYDYSKRIYFRCKK